MTLSWRLKILVPSHIPFNKRRDTNMRYAKAVENVKEHFPNTDKVLLIFNRSLDDSTHFRLRPITRFEGSIVEDEQYYLYQILK
jgi:hypothetical protein